MADRAVHCFVSGRVQGVWFRQSTKETADREGVAGWVRNLPDGRVEAHLQGDAGAVEAVLGWMRAGGPPSAEVTGLEVENLPRDPDLDAGFEVRR